jgi:hypothetical protein
LLHDVALADLHGEFSTVVDTATVLSLATTAQLSDSPLLPIKNGVAEILAPGASRTV